MSRLSVVLFALLAGCTSPFGPDVVLAAFDAEPVHIVSNPPVVTAETGEGTVTIRGEAMTGCMGQGLRATAVRRGESLLLRIRWTERGNTCPSMSGRYRYEAVLADLPPGTYRVQVAQPVHEPPNLWPVRVVLEQTVTVE